MVANYSAHSLVVASLIFDQHSIYKVAVLEASVIWVLRILLMKRSVPRRSSTRLYSCTDCPRPVDSHFLRQARSVIDTP